MNCTSCGTENQSDRKFCKECGTALQAACAACGAANDPGDKFCGNCGSPLAPEPAPGDASPVAAAAPTEPSIVEGKRFVSVLFADIVSYTTFSESRDSEDIRDMLTVYFDRAREIIERFGGAVDKFIGDAVMGVWGATVVREDDAQRAVRAALELVDMVASLGEELGIPELALRAGVNSGSTSVGPGGNEKGLVVGDLVNVASRLQSIAEPGTVFVGGATESVTSRAIDYEAMGEHSVKGKTEPVAAWKALRVGSMVRGKSASDVRPPPFVGRERELRLLKDTLTAVMSERRAQHIAIIGEGGIGKTRLSEELKKHIDGYAEDIYWHQGRSPSYGDGVTFWALGEMVRQRAGIVEGEKPARARTRLRTIVADFVPTEDDREWIEPRLAGLLGLAEMPAGSRSELFAALRTFFQHIAAQGPSILVFEDLHWADAGMVEFISELVERSTKSPMLVVTLARPDILDRHTNWGSQHRSSVAVRLPPMSGSEMHQMITEYLPGLEHDVVDRLAERAAGFPLYAVEMVRMLTASGELVEEDGRYRYEGDASVMAFPDSLHAVIGARLDRLDATEQSLLQDGAVLGQTFSLDGIAQLRGEDRDALERQLGRLIQLEILDLEDDPRSPERGQYGFVQSLIREVAYNRLPRQERRAKHVAAADYLHTLGDPELAGVIAGHYMGAYEATPAGPERDDLIESAIGSLTDAAERAVELHSHVQAMSLLDHAVELAADAGLQADLRLRAADSANKHGDVERGLVYIDAALEHFDTAENTDGIRRAATAKSELLNGYFRSPDALDAIEEVYNAIDSVDDPVTVGVAAEAARSYALTNNSDESIRAVDRLLPAAAEFGLEDITLDALITKATAFGFAGRYVEAFAILRGVAEEAELRGSVKASARALNNLASLIEPDNPMESLEISERLNEAVRRIGDMGWIVRNGYGLAFSYLADGRYEETLASINEFADDEQDPFNLATYEYLRGAVDHLRGPTSPEIVDNLIEVLGFYREDTDPQIQAFYLNSVAQLQADISRWDDAFDTAMQVDIRLSNAGLYIAAQAAAWTRDLERLETVAEQLADCPIPSVALRGYVAAARSALQGKTSQASTLFADLIDDQSRKLYGSYLTQFRATFAMLVGQDDPAAAQAARDADEWLTRTGTETLRRLWAEGLPPESRAELAG
ncbi:MAG: AAA family ATPase [Acidimicrobiia bacterium]|nr:AAA family ATPase [Acidimicrobiia bacterium]MBT8193252.1 AAA family ATPase [Acidimicrobiia bacterium]NNF87692.1 AAA family ATPase [Acidimicrobiia bacterium]NNJ47361.1 AAA family ATPase [Acidimicrobiia bacterium]NNL13162.1 AAA family ATPase [Acidimicrobiia bacterium]